MAYDESSREEHDAPVTVDPVRAQRADTFLFLCSTILLGALCIEAARQGEFPPRRSGLALAIWLFLAARLVQYRRPTLGAALRITIVVLALVLESLYLAGIRLPLI